MDFDSYLDGIGREIDFFKNQFKDVGNGLLLTNHEIDILNQYCIPYEQCHTLKEILFYIEDIIQSMDIVDENLENISNSISERDYYQNTNK